LTLTALPTGPCTAEAFESIGRPPAGYRHRLTLLLAPLQPP
jgi:hypothetical protein